VSELLLDGKGCDRGKFRIPAPGRFKEGKPIKAEFEYQKRLKTQHPQEHGDAANSPGAGEGQPTIRKMPKSLPELQDTIECARDMPARVRSCPDLPKILRGDDSHGDFGRRAPGDSSSGKEAKELGQPMNIAVADQGGTWSLTRAWTARGIGSIDISIKKAYKPRERLISRQRILASHSQSGGQFFGIHGVERGQDHDLCGRHSPSGATGKLWCANRRQTVAPANRITRWREAGSSAF